MDEMLGRKSLDMVRILAVAKTHFKPQLTSYSEVSAIEQPLARIKDFCPKLSILSSNSSFVHDFTRFCLAGVYKVLENKHFRFGHWHVFGTTRSVRAAVRSAATFKRLPRFAPSVLLLSNRSTV
jgi:hypothetical protein